MSERRRQAALGYLAPADTFLEFALYRLAPPKSGREDSTTPAELYESFAKAVGKGEPTALLAVEVGDFGPFELEYQERAGASATAGVEAVARIGAEFSLSGKYGIDCKTGRIYVGAMNTRRGLRPQLHCGKLIRLNRREPVLCGI